MCEMVGFFLTSYALLESAITVEPVNQDTQKWGHLHNMDTWKWS